MRRLLAPLLVVAMSVGLLSGAPLTASAAVATDDAGNVVTSNTNTSSSSTRATGAVNGNGNGGNGGEREQRQPRHR